MSDLVVFFNVLIACALGGLVGLERQWRQRLAGLRTNSLVATGSALFVIVSERIDLVGDHGRIAAQVVSGIGFLGAGVIMRDGLNVRGLNTAATLWCSAAVGVLAGFGQIQFAVFGALLVVATNTFLRPVAVKLNKTSKKHGGNPCHYRIHMECDADVETDVRAQILQIVNVQPGITVKSLSSKDSPYTEQVVSIVADTKTLERNDLMIETLITAIRKVNKVLSVSWELRRSDIDQDLFSGN